MTEVDLKADEGRTAPPVFAAAVAGTAAAKGWRAMLRRRGVQAVIGVVALVLGATLFVDGPLVAYEYTFNSCLIAVFGAAALNMLMGTAGLVSVGNAAFLCIGAFASLVAIKSGVPQPVDVVVAAAAAGVAGIIIGLPAVRLRGLYLALSTLAGFFIVTYFTNLYQSRAEGGGTGGFTINPWFQSKGLDGSQKYWSWLLVALVLILLVFVKAVTSRKVGRSWRMIRDHEVAANAMGIPVTRYKMLAFALSSALIGIQGALTLHFTGSVSTDQFTLALSISYIVMVLVGGLDSIVGSVIGAAVVTALPVVVPNVLGSLVSSSTLAVKSAAISQIIYGGLVIIFVTAARRGIAGWGRWLAARLIGVQVPGKRLPSRRAPVISRPPKPPTDV